jgi:hypothetical protein
MDGGGDERGSEEPSASSANCSLDFMHPSQTQGKTGGVAQKILKIFLAVHVWATPGTRVGADPRRNRLMFYIWGPTARYE